MNGRKPGASDKEPIVNGRKPGASDKEPIVNGRKPGVSDEEPISTSNLQASVRIVAEVQRPH